jgi:cold shock protein
MAATLFRLGVIPRPGWIGEKGYGFITPDDGDKDLFVHFSSIDGDGYRALNDGARISYESEEAPKGPVATNVSELSG